MLTLEPKLQKIVENLAEDIREQKCVLLIGPEVVQIDNKSLIRHVHEALLENNTNDILYYYVQDSLFLFRDENAKLDAPRQIKKIYKNLEFTSDIYKKILEIPFHLIISLNPDTYLADAASGEQFGVNHNFRFFRFNGEASDEVPEATKECPLIYNLCGCVNEDESLILDYEDLFQVLRIALGPDGLPNNLRKKLKEARSFLFLGFDFEKWYSQLLLQLLTGDRKGRPKFALNTSMAESDAKNFLLHQFRVEFLGNDEIIFDPLYEFCKTENLLRHLKAPIEIDKAAIQELKSLIGNNDIGKSHVPYRTLHTWHGIVRLDDATQAPL
ncbi:MAG: SIR2 family protein [Saprospiraceae bacterium]|nr:SIR2 family protein [Saprospiraceae bacterium]